jgi:hypothetical protein
MERKTARAKRAVPGRAGLRPDLEADDDDNDGDDEDVEEGIAAGELGDFVQAMAGFVGEVGEAAGGDENGEKFGVGENHAEDQEDGGEEEVAAIDRARGCRRGGRRMRVSPSWDMEMKGVRMPAVRAARAKRERTAALRLL